MVSQLITFSVIIVLKRYQSILKDIDQLYETTRIWLFDIIASLILAITLTLHSQTKYFSGGLIASK